LRNGGRSKKKVTRYSLVRQKRGGKKVVKKAMLKFGEEERSRSEKTKSRKICDGEK